MELTFNPLSIIFVATTWTLIVIGATLKLRVILRLKLDKGKIWLIALNSNNKTGSIQRVKASPEGFQVPEGPFVKFEGEYAYIDRAESRPMFVYNQDTGKVLKATEGEAEEIDGNIVAKYLGNEFISRIANAGAGIDWAKIAVIVGVVALLGLLILGGMMAKIMGGMGQT